MISWSFVYLPNAERFNCLHRYNVSPYFIMRQQSWATLNSNTWYSASKYVFIPDSGQCLQIYEVPSFVKLSQSKFEVIFVVQDIH